MYANDHEMKHPLLSPVYADYSSGFLPTIIQVGTRDLFLSNCARLQRTMEAAHVKVKMSLWEGMWHAFHANPQLPEGQEAMKEMAEYLKSKLKNEFATLSMLRVLTS